MKKSFVEYYQTRDFDHSIPVYDVISESEKYPIAIFIKAKCTAKNPLRVMHAQPHQIEEHLSQVSFWNRKTRAWDPKNDEFAQVIPSYKLKKMSLRYVYVLDKNQNMVFCIDL